MRNKLEDFLVIHDQRLLETGDLLLLDLPPVIHFTALDCDYSLLTNLLV